MTRKDYVLIAQALSVQPRPIVDRDPAFVARTAHAEICRNLARALGADNPRFDRERFLRACGVPQS